MSSITAIEPQRRKGRVNIFVDSAFVLGAGERVVSDLRLHVGQQMSAEQLKDVAGAEEANKALESALGLLDVRPRATREIETRLRQKGYEPDVITFVTEKLTQMEFLNDAQFAQQWVEARTRPQGNRPLGTRRLATELYQKGVAKDKIDQAVAAVTPEDELSLARAAAAKKVRTVPTDPAALQAERQKLMGFLQRRGFQWDVVKVVVKESLPSDLHEE